MRTVSTIEALRDTVAGWRHRSERMGFVPTMGNLHEGHMALVEDASEQADRVVVSIFVNPMQFGPGEDLDSYPRTLEADREKLAAAGVDLVFAPDVATVYPRGEAETTAVSVPDSLTDTLCGASRPGHFRGVATVVAKLFGMVQPDVAVFGAKDFQQLRVIQRLTEDLNLPVEVVGSPTVREPDGLATSSRNQYLTDSEREIAPGLYRELNRIAERVSNDRAAIEPALTEGRKALESAGFRVDYLTVRDQETLGDPATGPLIVLGAAWLGRARLIDNIPLPA